MAAVVALQSAGAVWLEAAAGLLYPRVCQICGEHRASAAEGFVCPRCWQGVRFIRPPFCQKCGMVFEGDIATAFECSNCRDAGLRFDSARAAVIAHGLVLEVIHRYKYQRALWFEPFLANLLVREAAPVLRTARWDGLVPIPLHPTREREREFNQARQMAAHLSRATAIPLRPDLLQRTVFTPTQTKLTREKRADNVRNAFALRRREDLRGQRFVLVDDVLTTGATASACAAALRRAGADAVCVWTVARGI
jgi:ComF family protein